MATDPSAARTGAPAARASKPGRTNSPSGRGAIAAVGRACFRHRWLVLAAWLIIAAAGFLAAGPVSNGLSNEPGAKSIEFKPVFATGRTNDTATRSCGLMWADDRKG